MDLFRIQKRYKFNQTESKARTVLCGVALYYSYPILHGEAMCSATLYCIVWGMFAI